MIAVVTWILGYLVAGIFVVEVVFSRIAFKLILGDDFDKASKVSVDVLETIVGSNDEGVKRARNGGPVFKDDNDRIGNNARMILTWPIQLIAFPIIVSLIKYKIKDNDLSTTEKGPD